MPDNRTRFTSRQVTALKKSGALSFVANMFGVEAGTLVDQHLRSKGVMSGPSTDKEGRREIVGRLQKLSDKAYNSAVEAGFVKVLGQCWGIDAKRITSLRDRGYSTGLKAEAPAAKGRTPKAKGSKRNGKTTTRKVSTAGG